jgi:L-threonylcarbamoyladenylate synthase
MSTCGYDPLAEIAEAVRILRDGGLVAFPTETVYGLGADASNPDAVAKIFKVKGRPSEHPVIVHYASVQAAFDAARDVPDAARRLAQAFWPGPLTLILHRGPGIPDAVTGGQDTVGVRVPSHPVARELLQQFGGGVAAPSANKFGRISPTRAEHVRDDLGADAAFILEGTQSEVGIESTIIDLTRGEPVLLRPGHIKPEDIERVLGAAPLAPDAEAPRASGTLDAHYAPRAALKLMKRTEIIDTLVTNRGRRIAVLALEVTVPRLPQPLLRVVSAVPSQYAQSLYANLRELDAAQPDLIIVEAPPATESWAAVRDRLTRAEKGTTRAERPKRGAKEAAALAAAAAAAGEATAAAAHADDVPPTVDVVPAIDAAPMLDAPADAAPPAQVPERGDAPPAPTATSS